MRTFNSAEIARLVHNLDVESNVVQSIESLLNMEMSLELFISHGVKQLAGRYSSQSRYSGIAKRLLEKIQKMEDKSNGFRRSLNSRKRSSMSSRERKLETTKISSIQLPPITSCSEKIIKSVSNVIDVSKLRNLEESEYDRIRPTLVTLSAKQLKSFMDRNPLIEKIADGLFRRHCQTDCPEEVPKKLTTETWRTVHDVFTNWKMYNEAKRYRNDFDDTRNKNEIEYETSCKPFIISPKEADLVEFIAPMLFSCNSPMKKWSYFSNGILTISEKIDQKRIEERNANYTCAFTEIVVQEELFNGTVLVKASSNETLIEPGIPTNIELEQFVVFCRDPVGYHFYNKTYFNFTPKMKNYWNHSENSNSLIILLVTGMSHNQAMRHLKQSLRFAADNEFLSFSMFNKESKNESMKSFGQQEKIWELVGGCPKFLHTDSIPHSRKFGKQFDYNSNLYNFYNRQYLGQVDNCISDGSVTVEDAIMLWLNFTKTFRRHRCHFSLLHFSEISGPEDGKLVNLDEVLRYSLEEMQQNNIFENTTVVILGDGESERSTIMETESGRVEENYGFFMLRLSDKMKANYPGELKMISGNVDRLITSTDIADTLKSIVLKWNFTELPSFPIPERSLLDNNLSKTRSCHEAGILDELCICAQRTHPEEDKRSAIRKQLLEVVKSEVSTQKCLKDIEIEYSNIEFHHFNFVTFFYFEGFLISGTVRTDGKSSEPVHFHFRGKARFLNADPLRLELRENLEVLGFNGSLPIDRICADTFYRDIHENFLNP